MKKVGSQLVVAGVCALLGFLLAYQFKLLNKTSGQGEYTSDIIEEVDALKREKEELIQQNKKISDELKALEDAAAKEGEVEKEIKKQLHTARMRLGLVDVKGPGVEIVIKPKTTIFGTTTDSTKDLGENEIVYLVNLLWYARSEAISVNGIRVTPQMGIKDSGGKIWIGNAAQISPKDKIVIKAIGNKTIIEKALEFPETTNYRNLASYDLQYTTKDEIIIEKSNVSPTSDYITPIEEGEN